MKRKNNLNVRTSKRHKLVEELVEEVEEVDELSFVPDNYHSASSVHNYMLNDPVLDWLKFKKFPHNSNNYQHEKTTFFDFITDQGKKFEAKVIEDIKNVLEYNNISFIKIANNVTDIQSYSSHKKTISAINDQIGVIYQAVLHGNDEFKAYGSPDLLIRSDVVKYLFDEDIDEVPKRNDGKYNYVVVDIKFTTLKLRADGKFILNEARMPANKGQIMIYNQLLGMAQEYTPRYCYILGRGWKYTKKDDTFECGRFNERLGCIDTEGIDNVYNEKIKKAFQWLDLVKKDGKTWTYNPPSVPEIYPNMSNKYDNGNRQKKKIAVDIEEITQLWNCGVKQRELAHQKGIFKLSDTRLTSEVMGFPQGTKRTKLIDRMLQFNQGIIGKDMVVYPKYIDNNVYDWQNESRLEFYLDFEMFTNMFDDFSNLPNMNGPGEDSSLVFMAGLGVCIKNKYRVRWEYHNFRIPDLSNDCEYEMFDNLYKKIEEMCNKYVVKIENAKIYHWGNIEQSIVNRLYKKYEDRHSWEDLCLIDFCQIFQDEGILVKGVYGFGLKPISKAMISYGLFNIPSWKENVSDGLDAMVLAYLIYKNPEVNHDDNINTLIDYNHTDVKMLWKVIDYFRKNHTPDS